MAITRLGGANAISGTLPAANINDTSIGNITSLPSGVTNAGKVLQVVQSITNTRVATTSTTFTNLFTANITPSATSSKIFITTSIPCRKLDNAASNTSLGLRLLRDSTTLNTFGSYVAWNDNTALYEQETASFQYLDTPSSTSQITYKVQYKTMNASGDVSLCHDSSGASLTLMEIAG